MNINFVSRSAVALAVAAVLAIGGVWLTADHAHAQIDLTGDWDLTISGDVSDTCSSAILQSGNELTAFAQCDFVGSLTLQGTIDAGTGDFTISGFAIGIPVELTGTASADGISISGTWSAPDVGFAGTFTGVRLGELPTAPDISGDWNLLLLGGQVTTCSLSIVQDATGGASLGVAFGDMGSTPPGTGGGGGVGDPPPPDEPAIPPFPGPFPEPIFPGSEITATLDCGDLGTGPLQGSINAFDGRFNLSGSFGGKEWSLFGQPSPDVTSLAGTWGFFDSSILTDPTLPPGQTFPPDTTFVAGGTFTTLSAEQMNAGVIVVDCDGSSVGVQGSCLYFMDGSVEFTAQVHVVLPPVGGYSGFEIQVEFLDSIVSLSPPATVLAVEALWSHCDTQGIIASQTSASLDCSSDAGADEFIGPVVELTLACAQDGEANLTLGSATHFVDGSGATVQPMLIGATVFCFEAGFPFPVPLFPPLPGDGSGGDFASSPTQDEIRAPATGAGPSPGATPLLPFALLGLGVALATAGGLSLYQRRAR